MQNHSVRGSKFGSTVFGCILAWLLLFQCQGGRCATVTTADGLKLDFRDEDASVAGVRIGAAQLKLNGGKGGFYVVDMVEDRLLGKMDYHSAAFPGTRPPPFLLLYASPSGVTQ